MHYEINDPDSGGLFRMTRPEGNFKRLFFQERSDHFLAIIWNKGIDRVIEIDGIRHHFPANHFLCLMINQSFNIENAKDMVIWQFNKDFYCIVTHEHEVSCAGFLFYGSRDVFFIRIDPENTRQTEALLEVFIDEFQERDNIQVEMLRILLKRLIIKLTRISKKQQLDERLSEPNLDIVRKFNLLVESHYHTLHKVQDYADLMHKSPKTLSNVFRLYNNKSPLQIIQERIVLEAKRLLLYTDKNFSEIAYQLGFGELTHFSRFFKNMVGESPSLFRENRKKYINNQIVY